MLTGDSAFGATTTVATLARIAAGRPSVARRAAQGCAGEIVAIVERGLAVDRERRFQSAHELADALRCVAVRTDMPSSLPLGSASRTRLRRRRRASWRRSAPPRCSSRGVPQPRRRRPPRARLSFPFATPPGDTANAYLGVGIAEQLLDALADVPGLRVKSRTSSFALGPSPNVKEIGQRLGATAVLEGSVTRTGTMSPRVGAPDRPGARRARSGSSSSTSRSPRSARCRSASRARS